MLNIVIFLSALAVGTGLEALVLILVIALKVDLITTELTKVMSYNVIRHAQLIAYSIQLLSNVIVRVLKCTNLERLMHAVTNTIVNRPHSENSR